MRHPLRILAPAAFTASLAALLCLVAGQARAASPGFGYHDPRSFQIHSPSDVAATEDGGALLSTYSGRGPIRKFVPGKRPKVIAGGGTADVGIDPAPATSVSLFGSDELSAIPGGGFLDSEEVQGAVVEIKGGNARRLTPSLRETGAIAAEDGDGFLIAGGAPNSGFWIKEVDADGTIHHVAGNGEWGVAADGQPAADSSLLYILDVAALPDGGIVFSEWAADYAAIREVKPDGTLTTLAGGERQGFGGDGGPAVDATFREPFEIAVATDGGILVADGPRVRRIGTDGIIETVAGTGKVPYNGDGIPATEANISATSLAAGPNGSFLIGDFANGRIRRVSAEGTIRTIAGMPAPDICPKATYNGIQGGPGDDVLRGDELRDLIRSETGDDVLAGRGGDDCIDAGLDDDVVKGGEGDDAIDAENGRDRVFGGPGDDAIDGQGDRDTLRGEEGDDRLYGGFADDHLVGGKGDDLLDGNTGADRFEGEGGDDYIDAMYNERESSRPVVDVIDCGPGNDTVKANTYDRIKRNCEVIKGAAGNRGG